MSFGQPIGLGAFQIAVSRSRCSPRQLNAVFGTVGVRRFGGAILLIVRARETFGYYGNNARWELNPRLSVRNRRVLGASRSS